MMQHTVDIAGTGLAVLDRVYCDGRKSFEALGGSCANVLVSLAMLDRNVVPLLKLGSDQIGRSLVKEFRQAGAETRFISQANNIFSPVLAQHLDTASQQHCFSFVCPETDVTLPRYCSIDENEVNFAMPLLNSCHVFYVDRLSHAVLTAMQTVVKRGAIVYFEPSDIGDTGLLSRAMEVATIVKCSSDRPAADAILHSLREDTIFIVTSGEKGLEVCQGGLRKTLKAIPASVVRDTCGAGDMVSVGLIDWILSRQIYNSSRLSIDPILGGIVAGQRLAAYNCAFVGARGLFRNHSADFVRAILAGTLDDYSSQGEMFKYELRN